MQVGKLDGAPVRGQGDDMLRWDRGVPGDPGLKIIEAAAKLASNREQDLTWGVIHGELCDIDLQPLARMGYQHLESHPETSPMESDAAMRDRRGRERGSGNI